MHGRELEQSLAVLSPWTPSQLDQTARELRAAGLMPSGGRGLYAAQLEPAHAASFLIALAASPTLAESGATARLYGALPQSELYSERLGRTDAIGRIRRLDTFGEALAAILGDPDFALAVDSLEVCHTWPQATFRLATGQEFSFGYEDAAKAGAAGFRRVPIAVFTRINGSVLSQLALELTSPAVTGGWTAEA